MNQFDMEVVGNELKIKSRFADREGQATSGDWQAGFHWKDGLYFVRKGGMPGEIHITQWFRREDETWDAFEITPNEGISVFEWQSIVGATMTRGEIQETLGRSLMSHLHNANVKYEDRRAELARTILDEFGSVIPVALRSKLLQEVEKDSSDMKAAGSQ